MMPPTETLPRLVPKLWGAEKHRVLEPEYTLKEMTAMPGWWCSVHYHKLKRETFIIDKGVLLLEHLPIDLERSLEENTRVWQALIAQGINPLHAVILYPEEQYKLPAGTAHRFRAYGSEPCIFQEVSTADYPDDSYRLEPSRALRDDEHPRP